MNMYLILNIILPFIDPLKIKVYYRGTVPFTIRHTRLKIRTLNMIGLDNQIEKRGIFEL